MSVKVETNIRTKKIPEAKKHPKWIKSFGGKYTLQIDRKEDQKERMLKTRNDIFQKKLDRDRKDFKKIHDKNEF
jgi:hypothetical protein